MSWSSVMLWTSLWNLWIVAARRSSHARRTRQRRARVLPPIEFAEPWRPQSTGTTTAGDRGASTKGRADFGAKTRSQIVSGLVMSDFVRSYLTVAIFGALAGALVAAFLGLGKALRPTRPTPQKYLTYESGVDPFGDLWSQSNIRYYVFALLFVLFDVEAVFIFPWATRLDDVKDSSGAVISQGYGLFGLIEMGIFILVLLLGLVYAWRKGMLRWV